VLYYTSMHLMCQAAVDTMPSCMVLYPSTCFSLPRHPPMCLALLPAPAVSSAPGPSAVQGCRYRGPQDRWHPPPAPPTTPDPHNQEHRATPHPNHLLLVLLWIETPVGGWGAPSWVPQEQQQQLQTHCCCSVPCWLLQHQHPAPQQVHWQPVWQQGATKAPTLPLPACRTAAPACKTKQWVYICDIGKPEW
jgi:hypothetical protein